MGADVEKELTSIVGEEAFEQLKEEGRYQKDVY
jgi:sulfite reductase alpha subunit-like flavoprotein